jgi:uncharacterized membrane protein YuzA (DUF378 family)
MNYKKTKATMLPFWAMLLAGIGSVNWDIIGLSGANGVEMLFGRWPLIVKVIYLLIGFSGINLLLPVKRLESNKIRVITQPRLRQYESLPLR